ncbi:oncostatin-M-specific receptor subunit beta-like isoform X1 [Varanus komodoensis]|uniref:Oncostatin M receptor n=1 Tax=Varanus komodoensis TaxID=61221 RepID=A0A8D2J3S4_VARKO|nr:oncostatin-M-specific receptor subunit beta-like isoform X1 [Varanus komodoensis]XP_044287301.1 oncostatin-M-specific receptor subunit beta-like isoform X1 [Varanus komodoensis]XP_044287302.1 oncostatin-M-specific receptor subunit beta-like isoform X1 [Varanus komodoensis]
MDHLVFQVAVLYSVFCFSLSEREGNHGLQPANLTFNVSLNLHLQQILVEWEVPDDSESHLSGTEMVFNIEVYRTGENRTVISDNYTTVLNKSHQPLKWSWHSDVALECVAHRVRIRSMMTPAEVWSEWSPWKTVDGLDVLDKDKSYIFPMDKVVEENSSVTLCCIAKKNKRITTYTLSYDIRNALSKPVETKQRRLTFTEKNVPQNSFILICQFSDAADNRISDVFVDRQPDAPKDVSCETHDMKSVTCTWDPGHPSLPRCSKNFTLSDNSSMKIYCNCNTVEKCSNSCSFEIGEQTTYNLKVMSKNCLGHKTTHYAFDASNRVRPKAPSLFSGGINASAIELHWNVDLIKGVSHLLCEVSNSSGEEEERHNVTVPHRLTLAHHMHLTGLQPYTVYSLKVCCCPADRPFYKWSEWSNPLTIRTDEAAPSGQLDVWRDISPDLKKRLVTVFWKASPHFRAHGKIKTYEIFWEKLEESVASDQYKFVNETKNYKTIPLDGHSYKIGVSARNSVGTSTPSVIIILAAKENAKVNYIKEDTLNNTAHRIYISWKPQPKFDGYIVDWCNQPQSHPCDFQWKKFGRNDSSALILSDAFSPGVRYTFRVYGTQGNRSYLLEVKTKYLKELEPPSLLDIETSDVTSNSITLTWKTYPQDFQAGFIRGYAIYVTRNCTVEGSVQVSFPDGLMVCRYTIKDPHQNRFTVEHLEPSTVYQFSGLAYSTSPPDIAVLNSSVTTKFKRGERFMSTLLTLLIVPPVLLSCLCLWKCDCVRKRLLPDIPHPDVTLSSKGSGKPMDVSSCIPDKMIVMEVQHGSVVKQPAPEMTIVENRLYEPTFCPGQHMPKAISRLHQPHQAAYKPLESFFGSLQQEADRDNSSCHSPPKMTLPVRQESSTASSVELRQCTTYKPQQYPELLANLPISDENAALIAAQ